jgi:tetratricopeptide (TPR) repeat protein
MSEVFLSYRQTDDAQKQRVRAFAERLRDAGIKVILDQFFLDEHPGGPNDGWDKWSSDCALNTEYVLIIGTKEWFDCFEKKQKPGTGLGAACEADDLRHRIYEAGGVIGNIRVVLFDDGDAVHMPGKLKRYQCFHAERDFTSIVRWLKDSDVITSDTPRTSIPHNLPSLQPFFGREGELKKIAGALDPESRTWGPLINGPGGMGKTSLAVRAAYDASADTFDKIVFISLKSRVLDNEGERDLSGFLISGLAELLNELARELGHNEIAKVLEDQRPRLLHEVLRGTRTLLVLDNLESLVKRDRDTIFTFVDRLPLGCKAILTARGRIGSGGQEIILQELSEEAALATLADLAESNPTLRRTSEAERLVLYRETGGNPLLLRWTAGQIGRGTCVTIADAIAYLRSCPEGNDPLEFIFGDLVKDFSQSEMRVLCALTYFTLPAKLEHISEVAECAVVDVDRALRGLVNRSLIVPSEELQTFLLIPLVADFLRTRKPEAVEDAGDRVVKHAYALAIENGYRQYNRFPVLDGAWPIVAAALPRFLGGPAEQLQTMCDSLNHFLNFTGRWDERIAIASETEKKAVAVRNFVNAGWCAYQLGWVHFLRGQSAEVFVCAARAEAHWREAQVGAREQAFAIRLRGLGHRLENNHSAAIAAHKKTVELWRSLNAESEDVAIGMSALASEERMAGDVAAAERDHRESLRIAHAVNYDEGIATSTGNLALIFLDREDWRNGEILASEALSVSEKIGRQQLVGTNSYRLAKALVRQGKMAEALPHARRAVEIFTRLALSNLVEARVILAECES